MKRSSTRRNSSNAGFLAHALVLAVALVIVPSCSRTKDPHEDWKAPRMLEEGDRLLRANDLPNAEIVFRKGLAKAEKAGFSADKSRIFVTRLAYIAAAREDIAGAQKLFERMAGASSPTAMDPRVTLHLVVLLRRAGKNDEARAIAEKLAVRLAARPPADPDELPFYAAGWIAIDRLRTENVEPARAREATTAFTERFKNFAEERRPISAAVGVSYGLGSCHEHKL